MKAIGYTQPTETITSTSLNDIELPVPTANGHDLLVRVNAISVNPVDTKVRKSATPELGESKILGWDAVGTVESVGSDVTLFKTGDRVFYAGDITRSGSNAEFQLVDERIVGKAPSTLTDAEAAAVPLTAITAWELLFDRLGFTQDSNGTIMVIGAAGGVGSILVQLAKKLTNLTVIGTASRSETKSWLEDLGADHVINHRNPLSQELEHQGLGNVDAVISLTNSDDHWEEIIASVKPQGKIALIDDPDSINVNLLKRKSISLHWELMFTRSMFQTDDMIKQHALLNQVSELLDKGELKTTLGEHFGTINAENLMKAHQLLETQTAKGKIVLEGF